MSATQGASDQRQAPRGYEIRIRGHLDARWSDWFGSVIITLETNGSTLLTGTVVDQAALHGLLRKVRDLGMPLISVIQLETKEANKLDFNTDHRSNKETNT
jgi:hypothetical protein